MYLTIFECPSLHQRTEVRYLVPTPCPHSDIIACVLAQTTQRDGGRGGILNAHCNIVHHEIQLDVHDLVSHAPFVNNRGPTDADFGGGDGCGSDIAGSLWLI